MCQTLKILTVTAEMALGALKSIDFDTSGPSKLTIPYGSCTEFLTTQLVILDIS
jgi:hypothetical protein